MRAEEWPLDLVTCSSLVILTSSSSDVTGRMSNQSGGAERKQKTMV